MHTTGIVYSITNEQIEMVNMGSNSMQAMDFDAEKAGYATIEGKINEDTLYKLTEDEYFADTKTTLTTLRESGKSHSPLGSAQGSFVGMKGLNLYVENGVWKDGLHLQDSSDVCYLLRDIFDIDTLIEKGDGVFPLKYPIDFEGWTATNMELAIGKMSGDWMDLYGFDIPISIDAQLVMTQEDIETFVDAMTDSYPDRLTDIRKDIIRAALKTVGTGVFSEKEHPHDYLTHYHECITHTINAGGVSGGQLIDYSSSCTGGNGSDYIAYLYAAVGLKYEPTTGKNYFNGSPLPGDVIHYAGNSNWEEAFFAGSDDIFSIKTRDKQEYLGQYLYYQPRDVLYLGTPSRDIKLNYYIIKAGTPVFVELQQTNVKDAYGCVCLHTDMENTLGKMWWFLDMDTMIYDWLRHYDGNVTYQSLDGARIR